MFTDKVLLYAAFGAGLLATLVLASFLTPAHWWKRPNARALALLALGTWGIGSLLASLVQAPAQAAAQPTQGIAALRPAAPEREYQVYRDLNLRDGTGTAARRLAVVPAGASVTATGMRDGDWWQIRAKVGGKTVSGWASSLWLRRADEGRH
jgi:hypothetical protein